MSKDSTGQEKNHQILFNKEEQFVSICRIFIILFHTCFWINFPLFFSDLFRAGMNCQGYNRRGLDYYGMSTGYSYKCSPMSLIQCQNLERNSDTEVVQFRPGKQCAEVGCGEKCGCTYRNNTYTFGQEFRIGCQTCTCTIRGSVTCRCMRYNFRRREIRDMTKEELELYQTGKFQNTIDILEHVPLFCLHWFLSWWIVQILIFVILLNRIEGVSCLMSKLHMTYYMESSWGKNFFIF